MALKKFATKRKPSQAYLGNGNHLWEVVVDRGVAYYGAESSQYSTKRLRVPGGYIYRVYGEGSVFVPMPGVVKHKV